MQRSATAFVIAPLLALAACAAPETNAGATYQAPEAVTGTRLPSRAPQGAQSASGESIRAQGGLTPNTNPLSRPRGAD